MFFVKKILWFPSIATGNDQASKRQLEEEMAKEEADVLDSQEKIHTLGDSVEQTTGMLAADIEEAAAMKAQSTERDITEIEAEDENDNENFNDAANHADDSCFEGVCAEQLEKNFRVFIEAYPKRTAVKEAYTVWKKLAPDDELTRQMIAALEAQKKCSQ